MLARQVTTGTWAIDLDGVVWLVDQPIEGAARGVARLRAEGVSVLFATNNSAPTHHELLGRLARVGIEAEADELVSSAQAAAGLVRGKRVLAVAGAGALEALASAGCELVAEGPADAVVVGLTTDFTYERLARAAGAVRGGARLVGTNDDPSLPTPTGPQPGAGSLLAAVATAAGVEPEIAGKPHEPMAALIARRRPDVSLVVGDRPTTDGQLAVRLGVPFGLVLSGVTAAVGPETDPVPELWAGDLGELVDHVFSH